MLRMTSSPRKAVEFLHEVSRNVSADREITSFDHFEFACLPIFPHQRRGR